MRKILSLLLSVALVLGVVLTPTVFCASNSLGYILGDADGNGEIEMTDAALIQRYVADMEITIPYETLIHGDVDRSKELEVTDATFIQRYIAEMNVQFPIGEYFEDTQPSEEPTEPTFIVDKVHASAGETVAVAVKVKNNPGILGMTLALNYDNSVLTLTNSTCGDAVSDVLAFTKPGRYTNPCNFTWDGIELDDSQIKDGDLLILTFAVSANAKDGVYPIAVTYEEDSIIDKDLSTVDFDIINGSVTVGDVTVEPTTTPEPTQPAPITGPVFVVENIQASAGESVNVAVNIKNNPGVLGMTLTLSYNNRAMTLTGATSGAAVSDVLAFTKPGRFTNPCNFTWDGIELDDSQIKDGELLVLTFDVAKSAASGTYPITISFEEDSIFDKNLKPVDFEIVNGSVTVGNAVTEPTTAPEPTQPTQPATEEPVTGPAFVVEKTTASAGETVTVTVNLRENPGILGMTLTVAYDSKVLTLKDAASGSAVNGALTFTKPGKYTSPCNFTWDGIELNADQIKDGELLILTFDVASNAAKGVYPISLSYEEDSIISADLVPIEVGIVNGSVTVK